MTKQVPTHVAIIMDGNGRWAKNNSLTTIVGHKTGQNSVRIVTEVAVKSGVKYLTLFAFSSENWNRPELEVNSLMKILHKALHEETHKLLQNDIRLLIIGRRDRLSLSLLKTIEQTEAITANGKTMLLMIAIDYGGMDDILQAAKKLAAYPEYQSFTCDDFAQLLMTKDAPPVDLCIRTSGEKRISNFLLWQLAYAELYFTDTLWPDFMEQDFIDAIQEYSYRNRRFGSR